MKNSATVVLTIGYLLFSHSVFAEAEGVFSSSEVSTVKDVDKIDYDQKYQFILKTMFNVKTVEQEIYSRKSNKGAALKYLKRYQSQGRFSDKKEKELKIDRIVSKGASEDAYQNILNNKKLLDEMTEYKDNEI